MKLKLGIRLGPCLFCGDRCRKAWDRACRQCQADAVAIGDHPVEERQAYWAKVVATREIRRKRNNFTPAPLQDWRDV